VLLPDALIIMVSLHFEANPIVIRIENNEANGSAYNITLGVCNKRYFAIR
jgi:hypothetical protein